MSIFMGDEFFRFAFGKNIVKILQPYPDFRGPGTNLGITQLPMGHRLRSDLEEGGLCWGENRPGIGWRWKSHWY